MPSPKRSSGRYKQPKLRKCHIKGCKNVAHARALSKWWCDQHLSEIRDRVKNLPTTIVVGYYD